MPSKLAEPPPYTIPVRPFNINEALAGKPFIFHADARRADAWRRVSYDFHMFAHPKHPAWMAWSGEWLVFEQTEDGEREMMDALRMVEEAEKMSETNFTPGPWELNRYSNYTGWSVYGPTGIGAIQGCLAERWYASALNDEQDREMAANAHLITSAPELYAALKEAVEIYYSPDSEPNWKGIIHGFQAALAKAEGKATT